MKKFWVGLLGMVALVWVAFGQSLSTPNGRAMRAAINETTATPGQVLTLGTNAVYFATSTGGTNSGTNGTSVYVAGASVSNPNFDTTQFATSATTNVVLKSGLVTTNIVVVGANALGALDIDWSLSGMHTKTIGVNSTFTFSNAKAGEWITIKVTASGAFTATWPTATWRAGLTPTQTASKVDFYTFFFDGTTYYGYATQNF